MTVKELITELLECDLEANVDIEVISSEQEETFDDFKIESSAGYLDFRLELSDFVLVNKDEFEELEGRVQELEDKVDELEGEING